LKENKLTSEFQCFTALETFLVDFSFLIRTNSAVWRKAIYLSDTSPAVTDEQSDGNTGRTIARRGGACFAFDWSAAEKMENERTTL